MLSFGFGRTRQRVLTFTGHKVGVKIDEINLAITQPDYVGFEPNCCPSALTRTINALNGDALVTLTTEVRPYGTQEPTREGVVGGALGQALRGCVRLPQLAFEANNPFDGANNRHDAAHRG